MVTAKETLQLGEIWKRSAWGSRYAFVQARIKKEGYSPQVAERDADVWETALRELEASPPKALQPK